MAAITDFSTDVAKVRLMISDIDDTNQIFSDSAIQTFIDMARGGDIRRAAGQALRTIAGNEVLVQKRQRILDYSTDGPAEAKELRALADDLFAEADKAEAAEDGGAFDWAEMVNTTSQFDERIWKENLRGNY